MTSDAAEDQQQASREEDLELVRAVLEGDATAYRGLVEKYQNRVYHMVYGMLRNREDAKDITQEAFVKAYDKLESFRLDSSFYTWLYRIAHNRAIDFIRKQKRRKQTSFEEEIAKRDAAIAEIHHQDSPRRTIERRELYDRIMDAMDQLPPEQKQVVLLRELEGLAYKEIAEVMDIPEGTVMSRLYYARKKLQGMLASDKPD